MMGFQSQNPTRLIWPLYRQQNFITKCPSAESQIRDHRLALVHLLLVVCFVRTKVTFKFKMKYQSHFCRLHSRPHTSFVYAMLTLWLNQNPVFIFRTPIKVISVKKHVYSSCRKMILLVEFLCNCVLKRGKL